VFGPKKCLSNILKIFNKKTSVILNDNNINSSDLFACTQKKIRQGKQRSENKIVLYHSELPTSTSSHSSISGLSTKRHFYF
jgi:hypothetical protein